MKVAAGSPPQVRGKRNKLGSTCQRNRITPAGAGKTASVYQLPLKTEDHPRRCGENVLMSPAAPFRVRITPAGAGKTRSLINMFLIFADHPRRCGENKSSSSSYSNGKGSPPQVRGKRRILAACSGGCLGSPPQVRGKQQAYPQQ